MQHDREAIYAVVSLWLYQWFYGHNALNSGLVDS